QNCMGWTVSKRARKRRDYWRRGDFWRKPNHMKTTSASVTGATCQSSRVSANNGSCAIRKQKKRWQWCAVISSAFFPRTGRRFTRNGWRTSATGASAGRFGGDTEYRRGTARKNPKLEI